MFTNKTVALIGPADHIVRFDQAEYLKTFDLIVRINDALPIPNQVKRMTTDRCDVLYVWRKVRASRLWEDLKEIRLKSDAIWQEDWERESQRPYSHKIDVIHPKHFYKLQECLGVRPNTGLVSIADILSYEPKKLYITGITFYHGRAYYDGYVSKVRNDKITRLRGNFAKHRQDPQLRYFIRMMYNKVECDPVLQKIADQELLLRR